MIDIRTGKAFAEPSAQDALKCITRRKTLAGLAGILATACAPYVASSSTGRARRGLGMRCGMMAGSATPPAPTVVYGLDLKGMSDDGFYCPVNGCTNFSFGYWTNLFLNLLYAPSWLENPSGWGGTYMGLNSGNIKEVRFGTGSSSSKVQFSLVSESGWHHYMAVRSGSTFNFYYDGSLLNTQSISSSAMKNNGSYFRLSKGLNNHVYTGSRSVMYLCVFSRALDSSEVASIKNMRTFDTTQSIFTNCLIAAELNEGSGNVLHNKIGSQTMTMTGTASWNIEFNPA